MDPASGAAPPSPASDSDRPLAGHVIPADFTISRRSDGAIVALVTDGANTVEVTLTRPNARALALVMLALAG